MKIPSNDLFELIKSLSKSEKIYLKKFTSVFSQNGNKNYIKLFNEIEKQSRTSKYDEGKIKTKFKNEKFVKQLHVTKIYLYNLILKSLYLQNSKFNELSQLREMINQIEVLYRKGLFLQCDKIVRKASKLAEEEEFLIELIRIKYFEVKVEREVFHSMHYNKRNTNKNDTFNEIKRVLKLIENEFELEKYVRDIYSHVFTGKLRNKKDIQKLRQIMKEPLLKTEKNALTYSAKSYYYFAKANSYNILGEKEKDYEFQKKHIDFMESNPQMLKSRLTRYIKLINNFVIACVDNKKYEDHSIYLEKLFNIPVNKIKNKLAREKTKALIFRIYFLHMMNMSLTSGEYEDTYNRLPQIIINFEKYKKYIENSFQMAFYISFSQINFLAENYDESLNWINYVLNEKDYEAKQDFYCFGLLFNLVMHFELRNFELLEYITKTTLNYLSKKKRAYKFEKQFTDFIRKYSTENDDEKRMWLLRNVRSDIEKIINNPLEKLPLEFFDYLSWIISKIEGKRFNEVIKQKFFETKSVN